MLSVKKKVQKKILKADSHDKLWDFTDFGNLPRTAVAKALSDLCKDNFIARASHGYYYFPKKTILGIVPPDKDLLAIKNAYNKNASFACVSGLSGYNKVGLTTQVPNILTIACNAHVRIADKRVKYVVRNKPSSGTEFERIVLDALIDIEKIPDTTPSDSLNKIKKFIKSGKVNINDLGKSALKETPRVMHIIGALGNEFGMNDKLLNALKNKINPNTVVYSDISDNLRFAEVWRIKSRMKKI